MKDAGKGVVISDFEGVGEVGKGEERGGATVAMAAKQKKREGERIKKGKEQENGNFFLKITLYIEVVASYFPSTLKLPVNPLT